MLRSRHYFETTLGKQIDHCKPIENVSNPNNKNRQPRDICLTAAKAIRHTLPMGLTRSTILIALLLAAGYGRSDEVSGTASLAEDGQQTASAWTDRAQELVFHALGFIDVKYKYGGKSPDTGWDCSGYVHHVFKEAVGVMLPRNAVSMSAQGEPVRRGELQPGDLVFFNTLKRAFSHVGIYLGNNRFIHAPATGKSVQISNMASDYWARRYNGGRRIVIAQDY